MHALARMEVCVCVVDSFRRTKDQRQLCVNAQMRFVLMHGGPVGGGQELGRSKAACLGIILPKSSTDPLFSWKRDLPWGAF